MTALEVLESFDIPEYKATREEWDNLFLGPMISKYMELISND